MDAATLTEARRAELAQAHANARREESLRRQLDAALANGEADLVDRIRADIEAVSRCEALRRF